MVVKTSYHMTKNMYCAKTPHTQEYMDEIKKGQSDIMRLLRRKRTMSGSSDEDTPRTPTTPVEKPSPMRTQVIPRIGKIPLTPLSKASPKTDRRSWGGNELIDGKYSVTSKDKSVLERISQRVHRRGARVRKPHEVIKPQVQHVIIKITGFFLF